MKKMIAMLLAVCLLSGCTLAAETKDGADGQLMGFLLTVTLPGENSGQEIWDEDAAGMGFLADFPNEGQRLYAQKTEEGYAFPENCGLSCFGYYVFTENQEDSYRTSENDPELSDHHWYQHVGDGGSTYKLEANVYGIRDCGTQIQVNPVYQTADGEIYALATAPMTFDAGNLDGYAATISQEQKTELGHITTMGGSVTVNINSLVLPERYIVVEMDAENQLLKRTEFAPDAMPGEYIPGKDAAYIILEAAGEQTVRTAYSPDDECVVMDTYYPGRYGLCIKGYTRISWEGVK